MPRMPFAGLTCGWTFRGFLEMCWCAVVWGYNTGVNDRRCGRGTREVLECRRVAVFTRVWEVRSEHKEKRWSRLVWHESAWRHFFKKKKEKKDHKDNEDISLYLFLWVVGSYVSFFYFVFVSSVLLLSLLIVLFIAKNDYYLLAAKRPSASRILKAISNLPYFLDPFAAVSGVPSLARPMSRSVQPTLEDAGAHGVQALLGVPLEASLFPAAGPAPRTALLRARSRSRSPLPKAAVFVAPSCLASAVPRGCLSRALWLLGLCCWPSRARERGWRGPCHRPRRGCWSQWRPPPGWLVEVALWRRWGKASQMGQAHQANATSL